MPFTATQPLEPLPEFGKPRSDGTLSLREKPCSVNILWQTSGLMRNSCTAREDLLHFDLKARVAGGSYEGCNISSAKLCFSAAAVPMCSQARHDPAAVCQGGPHPVLKSVGSVSPQTVGSPMTRLWASAFQHLELCPHRAQTK